VSLGSESIKKVEPCKVLPDEMSKPLCIEKEKTRERVLLCRTCQGSTTILDSILSVDRERILYSMPFGRYNLLRIYLLHRFQHSSTKNFLFLLYCSFNRQHFQLLESINLLFYCTFLKLSVLNIPVDKSNF
jgi:hypothetical protein